MKKKLLVCLFACAMALSFAVPAVAAGVDFVEPASESILEQEIAPFNEEVQIAFRTYHGVLQWRLWSVTRGRWITEWTNV